MQELACKRTSGKTIACKAGSYKNMQKPACK